MAEQKHDGGTDAAGGAQNTDRERVVRESREAGLRSQGGGSADEEAIRKAAREGAGAEGDQPSGGSSGSATP
ncbi:MAG TPA: hypothetical protein VGR37_19525 [Longimicrobiaceae bacterium]|nr:hypothetical protein [Longimicrobiaceae bacterium]